MQIHDDQKTGRARIRCAGALLGSLCLAAAGCAGSHENEREHGTTHTRSHDVRHNATDADGVERDRDGRVVRDAEGRPVRDADGRPVGADADVDNDGRARTAEVGGPQETVKPVAIASPANAGDANTTDSDRQLTAKIRKAISADDKLSTNAKNVQITSNKDEVTLRGPVATAEEKTRVESHAQQAAGSRRVNNQLEVTR
jgi:hyperosmotically inducible protein